MEIDIALMFAVWAFVDPELAAKSSKGFDGGGRPRDGRVLLLGQFMHEEVVWALALGAPRYDRLQAGMDRHLADIGLAFLRLEPEDSVFAVAHL
jgi:hypothetical protein